MSGNSCRKGSLISISKQRSLLSSRSIRIRRREMDCQLDPRHQGRRQDRLPSRHRSDEPPSTVRVPTSHRKDQRCILPYPGSQRCGGQILISARCKDHKAVIFKGAYRMVSFGHLNRHTYHDIPNKPYSKFTLLMPRQKCCGLSHMSNGR